MFGRGEYDTFSVYPVLGVFSKALSLGCGCLIPTVWWKYGLFLRFFCWRAPCLRHLGSFFWNFKKTSASPYDGDFSKNEKREPTFVDSLGVILFEVLVGMKGFEPSTPWTPFKCAPRLRYIPARRWRYLSHAPLSTTFCGKCKLFLAPGRFVVCFNIYFNGLNVRRINPFHRWASYQSPARRRPWRTSYSGS